MTNFNIRNEAEAPLHLPAPATMAALPFYDSARESLIDDAWINSVDDEAEAITAYFDHTDAWAVNERHETVASHDASLCAVGVVKDGAATFYTRAFVISRLGFRFVAELERAQSEDLA